MASTQTSPQLLVDLPPEVLAGMVLNLRPRSLRRFGATCRTAQDLSLKQRESAAYGRMLAQSALARVAEEIVKSHTRCQLEKPEALKQHALKFVKEKIISKLAGCVGEIDTWDHSALLHFLYPVVAELPTGWALAPYALEWCAENAFRIPGIATGPQREILALLQVKPVDVLTSLIEIAKTSGWSSGVVYLKLSKEMIDLMSRETRAMIGSALCAARKHLTNTRHVSLAVAVEAATMNLVTGGNRPVWTYISHVQHVPQLKWKQYVAVPEADATPGASTLPPVTNWLSLLGLRRNSTRDLRKLLGGFRCEPSRDLPPGPEGPFGQFFNQMLGQMAEMQQLMRAAGAGGVAAARAAGGARPDEMLAALLRGEAFDIFANGGADGDGFRRPGVANPYAGFGVPYADIPYVNRRNHRMPPPDDGGFQFRPERDFDMGPGLDEDPPLDEMPPLDGGVPSLDEVPPLDDGESTASVDTPSSPASMATGSSRVKDALDDPSDIQD